MGADYFCSAGPTQRNQLGSVSAWRKTVGTVEETGNETMFQNGQKMTNVG